MKWFEKITLEIPRLTDQPRGYAAQSVWQPPVSRLCYRVRAMNPQGERVCGAIRRAASCPEQRIGVWMIPSWVVEPTPFV